MIPAITYPSLPPRRFGIGTKDLHKGFCFPHDPHLETQTDRPQAFFSWSSPAASESVASVRGPRGPLGGCRPAWLSPLCLGSTWFESAAPIRINDSYQDLAFIKMQISGILMAWPMTPGKKTIELICLMTLLGVCWVYATNHMRCLLHKFVNLNIDQKLYIESILAWQYRFAPQPISSFGMAGPSPSTRLGKPVRILVHGTQTKIWLGWLLLRNDTVPHMHEMGFI